MAVGANRQRFVQRPARALSRWCVDTPCVALEEVFAPGKYPLSTVLDCFLIESPESRPPPAWP